MALYEDNVILRVEVFVVQIYVEVLHYAVEMHIWIDVIRLSVHILM